MIIIIKITSQIDAPSDRNRDNKTFGDMCGHCDDGTNILHLFTSSPIDLIELKAEIDIYRTSRTTYLIITRWPIDFMSYRT